MITPAIEISLYLSAIFALGLALGWAVWSLGSRQEIEAIAKERNYWKKCYDLESLKSQAASEASKDAGSRRKNAK